MNMFHKTEDRLNFNFVEDIHVVCEKRLVMVVTRTFRPVANSGHQALYKYLEIPIYRENNIQIGP